DECLNIESLATKYPIVDWETQIVANDKYYYKIKRADESVKYYKIFSAMLYDFDRQDVLELYRLVKERFQIASPEGYDLFLWGDLKTMMEPNEEDEIWRNQKDWNLINWKLHNFCGVHVLLMDTGFVIHMMVEKKYPLSQDTLSKMLSRRLEVDHQSEIGYELVSTNWVSTASTELNTTRRLSTAAFMEFESAQSNTTAKLPILKLGEYEMWVIRIKQYFQVQDYALWEVIENGVLTPVRGESLKILMDLMSLYQLAINSGVANVWFINHGTLITISTLST
ncbi:hypothetical protein Tco_1485201, partial [Tanacetum coccineum]